MLGARIGHRSLVRYFRQRLGYGLGDGGSGDWHSKQQKRQLMHNVQRRQLKRRFVHEAYGCAVPTQTRVVLQQIAQITWPQSRLRALSTPQNALLSSLHYLAITYPIFAFLRCLTFLQTHASPELQFHFSQSASANS
ncbi:hypothetical protein niasHT_025631 [Heterodera trifolii]|uniref:Uncharacterized protein n=1 Tax=Heterodera trifolii TaxID=157864 RepID=A0ABD2KHQ3_9BILA